MTLSYSLGTEDGINTRRGGIDRNQKTNGSREPCITTCLEEKYPRAWKVKTQINLGNRS